MKFNSSIYLISLSAMFNPGNIKQFGIFDSIHSQQLYSALALNNEELLSGFYNSRAVHFCFDQNDEAYLPKEFSSLNENLIFVNTDNNQKYLKEVSEKYINRTDKNLLIFSNSIGFEPADIKRVFSLLTAEDETIVIGKTKNLNVAFIGFNSRNADFLFDLELSNLTLDKLLLKVNTKDVFIHVVGNFMSIKKEEDFKNLYIELSKKESLSYCSHKIHELFTNLFIEYKELLK